MRLLLAPFLLCLIALAACGGGEASSPTDSPSATATRTPRPTRAATPSPSPSPAPTPEPTPEPTPASQTNTLDLTGSQPKQGGFLLARLLGATAGLTEATVYFTGVVYNMVPEGDLWYAFIGLPTWFTIGGYPIEVYTGDTLLAAGTLTVIEGGFDFVSIEIPPGPAGLLTDTARIEEERQQVEAVLSAFMPERYWSGTWITPTQGTVTSNFGEQRSINGGAYFGHTGHDIANAEGTPVYASASGVVAFADMLFLYGNSVIVDHGVGVFSDYSHLSSFVVTPGQWVTQGDLIGYMGTTGLSSGPHLHWEAVIRNVRVDPRLFTYAAVVP